MATIAESGDLVLQDVGACSVPDGGLGGAGSSRLLIIVCTKCRLQLEGGMSSVVLRSWASRTADRAGTHDNCPAAVPGPN